MEQYASPCLVAQLARFGDVIQSKRLIKSLVSRGAETHLLVDESLTDLARLVYPGVVVHGCAAHKSGLAEADILARNLGQFKELSRIGFARVYNLNFSGLNYALAGLFDPGTVAGYRLERGSRVKDAWCAMVTRWASRRMAHGLNLVDFWAHFDKSPIAAHEVNPQASPKGGGIGVAVAGRHSRRSLPPEVLAPVVAALAQRIGASRITLLGGKTDRKTARELMDRMPAGTARAARDMTGKTSYADLAGIVAGLDMLITPDTGAMHLAAHLGTPVQAMFLSSAWCFETGPYGLGHTVWQAVADCAPCLESAACAENVKCLDAFAHRAFLRGLTGKGKAGDVSGMLGLNPVMDGLGCTYEPFMGEDPAAAERARFRSVVAEHLGAGVSGAASGAAAQNLFLERDWMLANERNSTDYLECL